MRSESCSFIWQPNVVTWNAFTGGGGYELLALRGGSEGGEISRGVANASICDPQTTPDASARRTRRAPARRREPRRSCTRSGSIGHDDPPTGSRAGGFTGSTAASTPSATRSCPREGRWLAAVMACGDGAALSHRSAAALWGIRPTAAARIDVTVPRTSGVRSSSAIVVHRPRRPPTDDQAARHPGHDARPDPRRPGHRRSHGRDLEKAVEMAEVRKLRHRGPGGPPRRRAAEAGGRPRSADHDRQPARGRVPRPVRRPRHPAAARPAHRRGPPSRLLLARAPADRRDRRLRASRHARRVRTRSREGRSADGARLAGAALHRAAGPRRRAVMRRSGAGCSGGRSRPRAR